MDRELAQQVAAEHGYSYDELVTRWDGSPEKIAEDLFRARDPDTGEMESITLFPYQCQCLHAYFYGDNTILNVYKGRRIGLSYVACMAIGIDGVRNKRMTFPIIATKEKQAQDRIEDLRTLFKSSPLDYDELVDIDNKGYIRLFNGSEYIAYTANPDNARGISAKTVFIDEMAFIENQEEVIEAFMPTISLGSNGQMLQISTPRVSNDLFMDTYRRGRKGADDVISIKQPTFKWADDININVPLTEQDITVVRPDLNPDTFESQRRTDPMGFAQEYLCRPISDEYRFFSEDSVSRAEERGSSEDYNYGPFSTSQKGGILVAGIDLASGSGNDDTVISVFEHYKKLRFLRYKEVVDRKALELSGILDPDPGNPNHLLRRFRDLKEQMGIDHFIIDATGMGKFFDSNITNILGRGVHKFDFNDKDAVMEMAGDLNAHLREDMVTLVPDEDLHDQLASMVKEQKHDYQKPKLTGKEYSKSGKDDQAMSVILGAYPVMLDTTRSSKLHEAEKPPEHGPTEGYRGGAKAQSSSGRAGARKSGGQYSSRTILRSEGNGSRSYSGRHARQQISRY